MERREKKVFLFIFLRTVSCFSFFLSFCLFPFPVSKQEAGWDHEQQKRGAVNARLCNYVYVSKSSMMTIFLHPDLTVQSCCVKDSNWFDAKFCCQIQYLNPRVTVLMQGQI